MSKRVIITFPVSPEFRDKINTYCEVNKDKELSRAALCRIREAWLFGKYWTESLYFL